VSSYYLPEQSYWVLVADSMFLKERVQQWAQDFPSVQVSSCICPAYASIIGSSNLALKEAADSDRMDGGQAHGGTTCTVQYYTVAQDVFLRSAFHGGMSY